MTARAPCGANKFSDLGPMILDKSDQVILIKIKGVVAIFLILALEFVPKGLSR